MRWRILAPVAFAAAVVFTLGAIGVRTLIERSVSPEQVRGLASEALGRNVEAASVEISAIYGLVLRDVVVREKKDSELILSARTIRISPRWTSLMSGVFEVAKIRVIDADLYARKDTHSWNLVRLASELNERKSGGEKPLLITENLRLQFDDRHAPWHEWTIRFQETESDFGSLSHSFEISSIANEKCAISGTLSENQTEISFEDLPRALAKLIDENLDYEGLNGQATVIHSPLSIAGELSGKRLLYRGQFNLGTFRCREISGHYQRDRDGAWDMRIENLKTGPLKLTANLQGNARAGAKGVFRGGKIEWDGPIENLLELLPREITTDIARFSPRGSSAGHVLVGGREPEVSVTARGVSIQTPDAAAAGGALFLPPNTKIANIRGRIGRSGAVVTMDSLTMKWGDDPLAVTGHVIDATHYDVMFATERFDIGKFKGVISKDMTIDGKIGAHVRVRPTGAVGTVAFLGNNFTHSSGLKLYLTGGNVNFGATDSKVALAAVSAKAGDGTLSVDGTVDGERLNLKINLTDADLTALAASAGKPLAFENFVLKSGRASGVLSVRGAASSPEFAGEVSLADGSADLEGQTLTQIAGGLKFDSTSFQTPGLTARVGDGGLRIEGRRESFKIALTSINSALFNPFLTRIFPDVRLAGPVDADLVVKNTAAEGVITFKNTDITSGTGEKEVAVKSLAGTIEIKSDRMIAKGLTGTYMGGPARIDGTIPKFDTGTFGMTLTLAKARLEHFNDFAPDGFSGRGPAEAITIYVNGPKASPDFGGTIRMAGTTLHMPFLATDISDVKGEATFGPDSFVTKGMTFKSGTSAVRISGGLENFDEPVLHNLTVRTAEVRLDDLVALLPESERPLPQGAKVSGTVVIDTVRIDGPLDRAKWNGSVTLKGVGGELPGLLQGVTGIVGRVDFADGKVKAENLAGKVGSSDVHLEGQMDLAAPYALSIKLAIADANLEELWSAIPKPESWKASATDGGMNIKGRGNIIASIGYANEKLNLQGKLTDADASGFGMPFNDLSGSFKYEGEVLTLSDLSATWAQGKTSNGFLQIALGKNVPTFKASGQMAGAHLDEMVKFAGFSNAGYRGQVDGDVSLTGIFGSKESLNGTGSVLIRRARFEQLAPLDGLSRTLRMDFFSKGTYESAKGKFTIDKGVVRTADPDHFRFMGSNFTLEVRGYSTLAGACVYNYACGIEAGFLGNVMTTLRLSKLFSMEGEGGILRTSGSIRGTMEKPVIKTDLGILNLFR